MSIDWNNILTFLMTVAFGIVGSLYKASRSEVKEMRDDLEKHERRIQKMEDLHGDKLSVLEKKIDTLEISIQTLAKNLHKDKNETHQLELTLLTINKTLINLQDTLDNKD